MDKLNILLNYSKAVGLADGYEVDNKYFEMFMQLDYIYRNINKTEIAKDLLTNIKAKSSSYTQFIDLDNIRMAYYILVNKLYKDLKLNSTINFYGFRHSTDKNYFNNLLDFIKSNIGNTISSDMFDVTSFVNITDEPEVKELKCSSEVKAFITEMVSELAEDIVKIQSSLYDAGYDGIAPDGVLWKVGQLAVEPNMDLKNGTKAKYKFTQHSNPSLLRLYQYINKVTNNQFSLGSYDGHMKVKLSNIEKGCYYYPHFQVRNSCGLMGLDASLDRWLAKNKIDKISTSKELKSYITDEVTKAIMNCISEEQDNLNLSKIDDLSVLLNNPKINSLFEKFKKAFTTCALISESKKDVILKLRVCTGSKDIASLLSKENLEQAISAGLICNKYTKVSKWDLDESGRVLTVTFMMDSKRYNTFPLFAANILDSVKKNGGPSWERVIIGKDDKDRMFTLNLASPVNRLLAIIAGSRSGKGVLTLMIESAARALGITTFYFDYKPDMSKTLYNMARKLGVETFSFDGSSLSSDLGRDFNVLYDYQSIPAEIREAIAGGDESGSNAVFNNKEFAYFTSYIRGVQLMCKLIALRAKAYNNNGVADGFSMNDLGGDRVLFVLDEIEKLAIYADDLTKKGGKLDIIANKVKDKLIESGVSKAKADIHPCLSWFRDYKSWVNNVFMTLASYDRAEVALAKANIIILAQSVNIDETWGVIGQHLGKMIIDGIKFCGNGSATGKGSRKYGSSNCPPEWTNELPNRYFIIQKSGGGSVYPEGSSLVKTYFLLNEVYSEDGSESNFVSELMRGLGQDADDVRKEITLENGKLNPALGYYGYIKELTGLSDIDLANTFQRSYDLGTLIAKQFGHTSLLEYMYDLHNFSTGSEVYQEYNEALQPNHNTTESYNGKAQDGVGVDYSDDTDTSELDFSSYVEGDTFDNLDETVNGMETYGRDSTFDIDSNTDSTEENEEYSSEEDEENIPEFYTRHIEPELVNHYTPNNESAFSYDRTHRVVVDRAGINSFSILNNDNSIDCRGIGNSRVFKNSHKLARTAAGALVFKRDASKFIFNVIKNNIGLNNVTKVSLINESMIVNNKVIDLNGIVGGDTHRKLSDILSFREFNSAFRSITYLELNGNFVDTYILEFDLDVSSKAILEHIFNSFNLLSEVKINDNLVTRTKFTLENRKLDRSVKEGRQRRALDSMFNSLSGNRKPDDINSTFKSTSASSSKYERTGKKVSLFGRAREAIGIGFYNAVSFIDWLSNGRR